MNYSVESFLELIPSWIPLSVLAAAVCYWYLTWNYDIWSKQNIPGPRPYPLIGTIYRIFGTNLLDVEMLNLRQYGRFVGLFTGRSPDLVVSDPEFLRLAMIGEFSSMPNRREVGVDGPLRASIIFLKDAQWKHVRSLISPTFTSGKLKQMKPLIDDCGDILVEHIRETCGKPFNLKQFCSGYTMDAIARTAFGIHVDSQRNPNSVYMMHARRIIGSLEQDVGFRDIVQFISRLLIIMIVPKFLRPLASSLGMNIFDAKSVEYFEGVINDIMQNRDKDNTQQKDFVQLCMDQLVEAESGASTTHATSYGEKWTTNGLTRTEIVGNAILFLLAGNDTVSQTLQFFFYEMAMNPSIQDKVYAEIKEKCCSERPSLDEISNLTYLDWSIRETLRLYPSAARFERTVDREVTIQGITLPKGSVLNASVWAIHHNPEIWADAEEFKPERLSPENMQQIHPYAWIPFGIGNRNCIGMRLALMEMKLAAIRVLWNFQLDKCEETPEKPLKFKFSVSIVPTLPVKVRALPRHC